MTVACGLVSALSSYGECNRSRGNTLANGAEAKSGSPLPGPSRLGPIVSCRRAAGTRRMSPVVASLSRSNEVGSHGRVNGQTRFAGR
jgi:hypothetical protein